MEKIPLEENNLHWDAKIYSGNRLRKTQKIRKSLTNNYTSRSRGKELRDTTWVLFLIIMASLSVVNDTFWDF